MMLSARYQQRVLAAMYNALRQSDPRLVARYTIFSRLTSDEAIPPIERVRAWPLRWLATCLAVLARCRPWRRRPGGKPSRHLQAVLFIPLAAAAMLALLMLVAHGGPQPACTPARGGQLASRTASWQKPQPGAVPVPGALTAAGDAHAAACGPGRTLVPGG